MMYPTGNVKVTIETPDGKVHEVVGAVVELSVSQPYDMFMDYPDLTDHRTAGFREVSLTVSGPMVWTGLAEDKILRDNTLRKQDEWLCPYCGHINHRTVRNCGEGDLRALGCGANRPFVYG